MSKINFGVKFITGQTARKKELKFKGKISYNARHEAIENHDNLFENISNRTSANGYLTREESVEYHKDLFNDYQNENRILYFSNNQIIKENNEKVKAKNEIQLDKIQEKYPNACLYNTFTSFDYKFAEKNIYGKYSEEEFHQIIQPHIKKLFSDNDLNWDNTKYFLTFHSNKEHFHFHLDFIEQVPTRTINELDQKSFDTYRKNLMLNLDGELKQEYENNIKQIMNQKDVMRKKIDNIDINIDYGFDEAIELYKENPVRYYGDITDYRLINAVDKIKLNLINNNESLRKEFEGFDELLNHQNYFNENIFGNTESRNQKENQLQEVNDRLNNKILNMIKSEAKNQKEYEKVVPKNYKIPVEKKLISNKKFTNYKLERLTKELEYVAKRNKNKKQNELNEFLQSVNENSLN